MNLDAATVSTVAAITVAVCGTVFIVNSSFRHPDAASRYWSVAFTSLILMALAFTVGGMSRDAWWATAVGNGVFVIAIGMIWAGLRRGNARPSLFLFPVGAGVVVGVAAALPGPSGGADAGAIELFLGSAVFALLVAVESSRGRFAALLDARIISGVFAVVAVFQAARAVVFVALGPDSPTYEQGFGPTVANVILLSMVVLVTIALSALQVQLTSRSRRELDGGAEAEGLLGPERFRALSEVWLRRSVRDRTVLILMIIDLANHDEIAVAFGRVLGDRAVRTIGRIAVNEAPVAALVGQLAPQRFAVLTPLPTDGEVEALGDRVNASVLRTAIDDADRFRAATYIGIVSSRSIGARYDELLEAGAGALEAAAESGVPGTIVAAP